MEFVVGIDTFVKGSVQNMGKVQSGTFKRLSKDIIFATPVGDPSIWAWPPMDGYVPGRLRGNWFAKIGGQSTKLHVSKTDASGADTLGKAIGVSSRLEKGIRKDTEITLTNNSPYGGIIEKGRHTATGGRQTGSTQAPNGMLRISTTVARARAAVQEAVNRL